MSLALAAALAFTPAATLPACSWDKPGHDPFMGNVVEAVERYTNIPLEVRDRLKQRMAARQYDEIVTIGRDSITGQHRYAAEIRDMHFGNGRVCRTVSRSAWTPGAVERGLVYCEAGHCILVPTVCRNVSRITRLPGDKPLTAAAPALPAAPGLANRPLVDTPLPDSKPLLLAANGMPDAGELVFDPPGAGNPAADAGRAAIQSALASVASGGTANALGDGGLAGGGGGGGPGISFNPFPTGGGAGSGGTGDSGVPVPPFFPPVTGAYVPPTSPTDRLPGTVINPPPGVVVPPVVVVPEDPAPAVPEPGTWAMWAAGLAALAMLVRRRSAGGRAGLRS
jgi:MYXO-CTERM domain-containing protein